MSSCLKSLAVPVVVGSNCTPVNIHSFDVESVKLTCPVALPASDELAQVVPKEPLWTAEPATNHQLISKELPLSNPNSPVVSAGKSIVYRFQLVFDTV